MKESQIKFIFEQVAAKLRLTNDKMLHGGRKRQLVIGKQIAVKIIIDKINVKRMPYERWKGWTAIKRATGMDHSAAINLYRKAKIDLHYAYFKELFQDCKIVADLPPHRDEFLITC